MIRNQHREDKHPDNTCDPSYVLDYFPFFDKGCSQIEEWYQFVLNMHSLMLNLQNSFYLKAEGTLDTEIQNSLAVIIAGVRDQLGFVRYWAQRRSIFYPEFQAYIDAIMVSEVQVAEGLYEGIIPEANTDE